MKLNNLRILTLVGMTGFLPNCSGRKKEKTDETQQITCKFTSTNDGTYCLTADGLPMGVATIKKSGRPFFINVEPFSHRSIYFVNHLFNEGVVSYRGNSQKYKVIPGRMTPQTDRFGLSGGFQVIFGNEALSGNIYSNSQGLATELLVDGYRLFDSFPERGHLKTEAGEFTVSDAILYDSSQSPVGTINSHGEISWRNGKRENLTTLSNVNVELRDSRRGIVLRLKRQSDVTLEAEERVYVLIAIRPNDDRPSVDHLGYAVRLMDNKIIVTVSIRPLLIEKEGIITPAMIEKEKRDLEKRINEAIDTNLENRFLFEDEFSKKSYPIDFRVRFVSEGEDGEMQFYQDTSPECLDSKVRDCLLVRPSTHQVSVEELEERIPHEILHYFEVENEYPDKDDPSRPVIDPQSIMGSVSGGYFHQRHLDPLRQVVEKLLNTRLKIVPISSK